MSVIGLQFLCHELLCYNNRILKMGQQNTKSVLSIKIISTQTESLQLFDYHHSTTQCQQNIIKSPSFIVTNGETVKIITPQNQPLKHQSYPTNSIFKITLDDYQQIKIQNLGNDSNKTLWRVIKHGEMYPIKLGDTLKIGKIKVKLIRIVNQKNERVTEQYSDKDEVESPLRDDTKSINSNLSQINRCRICFSHFNKKSDPLVCLCKCSGSIKFTHFQCLKDWVINSITKRQDENYKFYAYNDIKCQLCKHNMPVTFMSENKQFSFFSNSFEPPYAEFGSQEVEEDGRRKYHKYIIKLWQHKQVLLGRNNTCQVMIKDISVSRNHCSLQYRQGTLFVKDKKSKFGTLVKVEKSLQFNIQHGLKLQFESTVIELFRKNRLKGCCCSDSDNFRLVYEVQEKEDSGKQQQLSNGKKSVCSSSGESYEEVQFDDNEINLEIPTITDLLQTRGHLETRRQIMHRDTLARDGGGVRY